MYDISVHAAFVFLKHMGICLHNCNIW